MSYKKLTPEERKERIALLYAHFDDFFRSEGLKNPLFIPKMAYVPEGKDEKHVTFFTSELENAEKFDTPKDIYIEFADIEYIPEDSDRGLYKWKFNPHWRTEYDLVVSKAGYERYAIPINELHFVVDDKKRLSKTIRTLELDFDVPSSLTDDAPLSDMTIRDLAAILLKQPVSKKEWLNKLIK
jgi:hypothetical protein